MGKSFKERPEKYRKDLDRKNKKRSKGNNKSARDGGNYSPFEDSPEYHESFAS